MDAKAAIDLLHYALFSEKREADAEDDDDNNGAIDADAEGGAAGSSNGRKRPAGGGAASSSSSAQRPRTSSSASQPYTAAELEEVVEAALSKLFSGSRDDCSVDELYSAITSSASSAARVAASGGREGVTAVLDAMEGSNKVMHRTHPHHPLTTLPPPSLHSLTTLPHHHPSLTTQVMHREGRIHLI